jgi:chemotaxis signal transduction protein
MEPDITCEAGITAWLERYSPVFGSTATAATDSAGLNYCIFRGGEDFFAVPLDLVEEIIPRPAIIEVPASPPFFLGTLARRTDTLPVIDLAMCATPLADPRYCLVLRLGAEEAAITIAIAADDLVWPGASRISRTMPQMQFVAHQAASRFIAGRITFGSIMAWALDPAQLTDALFAAVMH